MSQEKLNFKPRILGIAGSPRREGNSDILLREALAGVAASREAQIKKVVLSELNISPCRHCGGCVKTGKCVIEDDMQWLHTDLRETDYFIIASPIFFMGITAQTKAMIDRCQALWILKEVLKLEVAANSGEERKGLFISVGGARLSNLFQPAVVTVKSWFNTLDITYNGELFFPGVDGKGAIVQHPTALADAFAAGQKLVSSRS